MSIRKQTMAISHSKSEERNRDDILALEENARALRNLLRPLAGKIRPREPAKLIAQPWESTDGWWIELARWGEYSVGLCLDFATNSVRPRPSNSRFYWFGFWSEKKNSAQRIQDLVNFMPRQLAPALTFDDRNLASFRHLSQFERPVVELNSEDSYFGRYDCRLDGLRGRFDGDLAAAFIAEVIEVWQLKQHLSDEDKEVVDIQISKRSNREKQQLIAARRGQGIFRKRVAHYWKRCALTKCNVDQVLRASHIVPWKESDDDQKIDGDNGILLSASYDALFDKGLISFADDGTMLISSALTKQQRKMLGLPIKLQGLKGGHRINLVHHRRKFGFASR